MGESIIEAMEIMEEDVYTAEHIFHWSFVCLVKGITIQLVIILITPFLLSFISVREKRKRKENFRYECRKNELRVCVSGLCKLMAESTQNQIATISDMADFSVNTFQLHDSFLMVLCQQPAHLKFISFV